MRAWLVALAFVCACGPPLAHRGGPVRPPCGAPQACAAACQRGDADACVRLGDLASAELADLDVEEATPAWTRACELGRGVGCERLACVLLRDGQRQAAAAELKRACEHGACTLAHTCEEDARCEASAACAIDLPDADERQCMSGDGVACLLLGEAREDRGGDSRAMYQRACAVDIAGACLRAGNTSEAAALYRARCAAGHASACELERGLPALAHAAPAPMLLDPWRDIACGSGAPASTDPIVAAHCERIAAAVATWRSQWLAPARTFFATLRPATLPPTVLYPFGAGDLLTALAVFPQAEQYVTISLEPAAITQRPMSAARRHEWLARWRVRAEALLRDSYSTTRGLEASGIVELALLGIAANGCAVRGAPIAQDNGLSLAFDCDGHARRWRHVTADLAGSRESLAAKIRGLGDISVLLKATGFLMWQPRFAALRDVLLERGRWIVGDGSSIHPDDARARGRTATVLGELTPPFPTGDPAREASLRAAARGPGPPMPFGYGHTVVVIE